eukprot:scaffold13262_cov107-Isochrysis_galbana.AAC.1
MGAPSKAPGGGNIEARAGCVASLGAVNGVVCLANTRRCSTSDRLRSPLHLQVSHLVLKSQSFSPRRGVSPSCGSMYELYGGAQLAPHR